MAFVTNQWLKKDAQRSREHFPIRVTVEAVAPLGDWDVENGVAAHLVSTGADGKYQSLYLTEKDIDAILPYVLSRASVSAKSQAARIALSTLSDSDISLFLEEIFALRQRAR